MEAIICKTMQIMHIIDNSLEDEVDLQIFDDDLSFSPNTHISDWIKNIMDRIVSSNSYIIIKDNELHDSLLELSEMILMYSSNTVSYLQLNTLCESLNALSDYCSIEPGTEKRIPVSRLDISNILEINDRDHIDLRHLTENREENTFPCFENPNVKNLYNQLLEITRELLDQHHYNDYDVNRSVDEIINRFEIDVSYKEVIIQSIKNIFDLTEITTPINNSTTFYDFILSKEIHRLCHVINNLSNTETGCSRSITSYLDGPSRKENYLDLLWICIFYFLSRIRNGCKAIFNRIKNACKMVAERCVTWLTAFIDLLFSSNERSRDRNAIIYTCMEN